MKAKTEVHAVMRVGLSQITISNKSGKATVFITPSTTFGSIELTKENYPISVTPEIQQVIDVLEGLILSQQHDKHVSRITMKGE